jgi:aspartyl/asparaginyl beta-hydroxylase (cupin superfamily)
MTDHRIADPQVARILEQAEGMRRAGRNVEAVRLFEQAVQLDPQNAAALNALGLQALAGGDAAAAASWFARAAEADPGAAPLWMNLAKAQRVTGDVEGERASLLRVLDTDQRHFMGLLRLAELHERQGEYVEAVQRWSAVITLGAAIPDLPAPLRDVLNRAQTFVTERQALFGATIDRALEGQRGTLEGRDKRRFDAAIDAVLGRRTIYFNDCMGVHYPFLPADEYFDREHFPWMDALEAQTGAIRAEFEALLADGAIGFEPYVDLQPGTPRGKWSPLDKSKDWSAFHLWRHGAPIEEACKRCPITAKALEGLPRAQIKGRAPTAFFSILGPRAVIPPHTGVSNVRAIVHLPLIVPPDCTFRVGGETRTWEEGRAFAFDDTIEHEARNGSGLPRAVLIFDVWNPHLSQAERTMLRLFFEAADASGHSPDPGRGAH